MRARPRGTARSQTLSRELTHPRARTELGNLTSIPELELSSGACSALPPDLTGKGLTPLLSGGLEGTLGRRGIADSTAWGHRQETPVVNVNGKLVEATSPQARSGIFAIFTRGRALAVGQARTWAQITVAW